MVYTEVVTGGHTLQTYTEIDWLMDFLFKLNTLGEGVLSCERQVYTSLLKCIEVLIMIGDYKCRVNFTEILASFHSTKIQIQ